MKCRHCDKQLEHKFIDLGYAPASNAYLHEQDLSKPESYYPLKVMVCDECWLVQTEDYNAPDELFSSDYAYFSSTSSTFLNHASKYVDEITDKLNLNNTSLVYELASNDGYLLKNFVKKNIPCIGIEPTISTAEVSIKLGIENIVDFFSTKLAHSLSSIDKKADLIIGNNVYAHVPDINDFTLGMKTLLKDNGTITLEFPHLLKLIEFNQFDTIYHEHYSYLSVTAVNSIFNKAGLKIYDIEELNTHGGSLRIYGCHASDEKEVTLRYKKILDQEMDFGLSKINTYQDFQDKALNIKLSVLNFLITQKKEGKKVVAYGAAAKGNTLMNFSGVKSDLIDYVCDAAAAKQNKFMPGSHIPIVDPSFLHDYDPDYIIILPWNIADEIHELIKKNFAPNSKIVTFIPEIKVWD